MNFPENNPSTISYEILSTDRNTHIKKNESELLSLFEKMMQDKTCQVEQKDKIIKAIKKQTINSQQLSPVFIKTMRSISNKGLDALFNGSNNQCHLDHPTFLHHHLITLAFYKKLRINEKTLIKSSSLKTIKNQCLQLLSNEIQLPSWNISFQHATNSVIIAIDLEEHSVNLNKLENYIERCKFIKIQLEITSKNFETHSEFLKTFSKHIVSVKINYCDYFPFQIMQLENLRNLLLIKCNLTTLPLEIGLLKNLRELYFYRCTKLINLPSEIAQLKNLEEMNFAECIEFTTLPQEIGQLENLRKLYLNGCRNLVAIPAEIALLKNLKTLNLNRCTKLPQLPSEIVLLKNLKTLSLNDCTELIQLPSKMDKLINIKNFSIKKCTRLTELPPEIGPLFYASFPYFCQTGLNLDHCTAVQAFINYFDSINLQEEVRKKIFLDTNPFSFLVWVIEASKIKIPLNVTSPEKILFEKKIDKIWKKFKKLAETTIKIPRHQFRWFDKCLNNSKLNQKMKHIAWFCDLLLQLTPRLQSSLFSDQDAYSTLESICKTTNAYVKKNATTALISIYKDKNKEKLLQWKIKNQKLAFHQLLPHLFFVHADIDINLRNKIIAGLKVRFYQNSIKNNPIVEMISKLLDHHSLPQEDCERILKLTLLPPEQPIFLHRQKEMNAEKKRKFNNELLSFRAKQLTYINAVKSLININQINQLKEVTNKKDLLKKFQTICAALLGVKNLSTSKLIAIFESKRYPNGLLIYAASLNQLKGFEKSVALKSLGQFINSLVKHTFPESRYNLSSNTHLKIIFENNLALLEKWKSPLIIQLDPSKTVKQQLQPLQYLIKEKIKRSIHNKHLGANQKTLYPTLFKWIDSNDSKTCALAIKTLEEKMLDQEDQSTIERLHIEIAYLKLMHLSEQLPDKALFYEIKRLLKLLQKEPQFDIENIFELIISPNFSKKFLTIEDTDAWEDLFLSSTEIKNSCQEINYDPNYSKFLLAILKDGKNKVIIVRDLEGKIVARCILRILWDATEKHPILFMEKIYTRYDYPILKKLILKGCIAKAKLMGIPLVNHEIYDDKMREKIKYPNKLDALGSGPKLETAECEKSEALEPAPYEYVDALNGPQENSTFSIANSWLIYDPKTTTI